MKQIFFLLSLLVFLIGCTTQEGTKQEVCEKPYFEFREGECCLDEDGSGICDREEEQPLIETKEEETKEEKEEGYVFYKGRKMTKTQYEAFIDDKNSIVCDERDWNFQSNLDREESYFATSNLVIANVINITELDDINYYIRNNEDKEGSFKIYLTFRKESGVKSYNSEVLEEVDVPPNKRMDRLIKKEKILKLKPEDAQFFYLHIISKKLFRECVNQTDR